MYRQDGEEWRLIDGYENYEVSSIGRIKSLSRVKIISDIDRKMPEIILKQSTRGKGYLSVQLTSCSHKQKTKSVHRLVAIAFIENVDGLETVNHKDLNKENNSVENLEWMSAADNTRHSFRVGDRTGPRGEASSFSKLTTADVTEIKLGIKLGVRTLTAIATDYGVCVTTISEIKSGRSWGWLNVD